MDNMYYNGNQGFNKTDPESPKKKKRVWIPILIISLAVVVIAGVIIAIVLLTGGEKELSYSELMDQAESYLADGDEDKAIDAYNDAINKEPKKPDAYIELADLYIELEEEDKARKILKKAKRKVRDDDLEEIEKRLKKLDPEDTDAPTEKPDLTGIVTVSPSPTPTEFPTVPTIDPVVITPEVIVPDKPYAFGGVYEEMDGVGYVYVTNTLNVDYYEVFLKFPYDNDFVYAFNISEDGTADRISYFYFEDYGEYQVKVRGVRLDNGREIKGEFSDIDYFYYEGAYPTPDPDPYIDLGGMQIIIRDWWHPGVEDDYMLEPQNAYEEARDAYREEMMKKYNFTIKEAYISDWGSASQDFIDYVTYGGDDRNYVFCLHVDNLVGKALNNGLMYNLSTLDCLNFNEEKFQLNKVHELMSIGSSYYAFFAGATQPRTGVYFNKDILRACGIDPDSIYDMQLNGTWTWDAFDNLMATCQRYGYYGLTLNESVMTDMAVLSNGGSYVGKYSNGDYYYNLESPETLEALNWCVDMYKKYDDHDPVGANWDYYQEEWRDGYVAFLVEQEYAGAPGNLFDYTDFDMGFVMFPKGPKASDYTSLFADNIYVIPACYNAERAWKIAFAWNLFTNPVPGYEDSNEYLLNAWNGNFDYRALTETIPLMQDPRYREFIYVDLVDGIEIGPDLTWAIGPYSDVSYIVEGIRDKWKKAIENANK